MSDTDESPSMTETLAAEADRRPRPEGTPGLWPFLHLPRRQKAAFLDAIKSFPSDGQITGDTPMETAAKAMALAADVEDALRIAARDGDTYRAWAKNATDEELFELFGWYMERFSPGEAVPSPS